MQGKSARWLAAIAITCSTSAIVDAQPSRPTSPPATSAPQTATPPPIVFPFQPLMPPPAGGLTTAFPFVPTDPTKPPRDLYRVDDRFNPYTSRPHAPVIIGYGGSYPFADYTPSTPSTAPSRRPAMPLSGLLRLSVTPMSAQVFVDSYYVGTVNDIDTDRGLILPAGPHRVEIRAPDYQTLTFDVRIDPNEPVTYRGALERIRQPAPSPPPSAAATRMYVIPKCYLGNVPPRQDRLPPGCSTRQVRIVGDTPLERTPRR